MVIPLYNKAPYIARALNSVLAQERLPEEIIVVDDGSTDGGGEVVKQFQDPLIRLVRQENQGVSAARNLGISLAKGELIAFLDADDTWKPGFIETIVNMRQLYPQAGAYATAYEIVDPKGKKNNLEFRLLPSNCEQGLIDNFFNKGKPQPLWTSAVVIPKDVFHKIGYFAEGEYLAEDIDMWIRIGICYPVAWNRTVLAEYRQDATHRVYGVRTFFHEPTFSVTVNKAIQSRIVPIEKMQDLREYAAYWQYWAVRQLILNGEKKLALKIIGQTRGTKIFQREGWILAILAFLPPFFLKLAIIIYRFFHKIKYIL